MSCPSFVPQPAMLSCRNSTSRSSDGVSRHLTKYGRGESHRNPDSSDLSTGNNALPCFVSLLLCYLRELFLGSAPSRHRAASVSFITPPSNSSFYSFHVAPAVEGVDLPNVTS